MSLAELIRARRWRLISFSAIAVVLVAAVVWAVIYFSTISTSASAHEAEIHRILSQSGAANDYRIEPTGDGSEQYRIHVEVHEAATPVTTAQLTHELYSNVEAVRAVHLDFGDNHELTTHAADRSPDEWEALIGHVHTLEPVVASFSQVGPTGAATYLLGLSTHTTDPAEQYETVSSSAKPDWLTYGQIDFSTAPETWPYLAIAANRDITDSELDTFRALNAELAATVSATEHYELKMTVELGAETAEFEMRIITEPLAHSPENAGGTDAPDETDSELPEEESAMPEDSEDGATGTPDDDAGEDSRPAQPDDTDTDTGSSAPPAPAPDTGGTTPDDLGRGDSDTDSPSPGGANTDRPTLPEPPVPSTPGGSNVPGSDEDGDDSSGGQVPERPAQPNGDAPSVRGEVLTNQLTERTELILNENGLSSFTLTIRVDNNVPLLITG